MDLWAFPVCRYYTIRAQHGEHSLRQRMGAERHPAVAGARGYRDNGKYLHPPHEAAEREHREGSGECVSEVGAGKQNPTTRVGREIILYIPQDRNLLNTG